MSDYITDGEKAKGEYMSNYREEVRESVKQYMEDNEWCINLADYNDIDDFRDDMYDKMFVSDDVTGNASGSFTFDRYEAKENVLADMDTVREALEEFGVSAEEIGEKFLNEEWEYLDVTARCYVLGEAVGEWFEENEEAITKAIEEAHEE